MPLPLASCPGQTHSSMPGARRHRETAVLHNPCGARRVSDEGAQVTNFWVHQSGFRRWYRKMFPPLGSPW